MKWAALVIMVSGCNQVFGLHQTVVGDADLSFFDAPADAPFACPAFGTSPRFKRQLFQAVQQKCNQYTFSFAQHTALGICSEPTVGTIGIYEGALDAEMSPVHGFAPPTSFLIDQVRLSSEGDLALAAYYDPSLNYKSAVYTRGPDGIWTMVGETNIPIGYATKFSSLTNGPRHSHLR